MEIVKKNLLSIIMGVIALVAIILYFYPRAAMEEEAQAALEKRIAIQSQIRSALSRDRKLPVVSLENAGDQPLGVFPTERVIEWGQSLTQRLKAEADGALAVAVRINRRPLLVLGSLPQPGAVDALAFRDQYRAAMSRFFAEMKAGFAPGQNEMELAAQKLWREKYQPQVEIRDGRNDPSSEARAKQAFDQELLTLPAQIRAGRAEEILVYAEPTSIEVHPQIISPGAAAGGVTSAPPNAAAIWYAQLNYWIQKDVAEAIYAINEPHGNVTKAPVKKLIKLNIQSYRGAKPLAAGSAMPPGGMYPGEAMDMGAMPDMGGAAPQAASSFDLSPTGRTSNAVYDVIPFTLDVHVEADQLPAFLLELSRNRFITAYQVSASAIDSVVLGATDNVVYGTKPVVHATIACEALMLRNWTVPLMPLAVRQQLGVAAQPGAM